MPLLLLVGGPLSVDNSDHDASASAAVIAADLISSARLQLKLDSELTDYSARYLVDNAVPKEGGKLTVNDCLEYALKEGLPIAKDWPPLGSLSKPPSAYKPALVYSKGDVIVAKTVVEADDSLWDHSVAAKLHVYTPQIDVQRDGLYCVPPDLRGGSYVRKDYVGLRDGVVVRVEKIGGESIATVKLWYKKAFRFVKVAMSTEFAYAVFDGVGDIDFLQAFSQGIAPTFVLVEFCALRLSIN